MTKVLITNKSVEISGHANFAEKGKDLVCAAISTITFGFANAAERINANVQINNKLGLILIKIKYDIDSWKYYLELLTIQFQTIKESYPEYIDIDDRRNYGTNVK